MATSPELELVWDGGSLDLMGENDTPYGPVEFAALADGTEWGNPQSVRRVLLALLADGSASVTDRHDNRTVVVKLQLTAPDSAALAGGEAPLHMLASKRRAELRWTPPNDFAAPAVYVVVASDLAHVMDDFAENQCRRTYTLTLVCLPFARSLEPVVIEALPPFVAAPSVLDDCTSTTGWAGTSGLTAFNVVSGGVVVSISGSPAGEIATLTKTLVRTKRYLAIEHAAINAALNTSPTFPTRVWIDGAPTTPPIAGIEGDWFFYDLGAAVGNITAISLQIPVHPPGAPEPWESVKILTIAESDTPAASAGRQSLRIIPTPGSARADGSLLVESRDADDLGYGTALGQVIVYTGPQYDPRLSPWRTGSTVVDAAALSGRAETTIAVPFAFVRPASTFVDGSHSLWVHAKGADGVATTWTVHVYAIGSPTWSPASALSATLAIETTTTFDGTGYHLFNLGVLELPGLDLGADSQLDLVVWITATGTVTLDEALVFNRSRGSLAVVDTRTINSLFNVASEWEPAVGATRVWLDAPSLASNGRVIAGRPPRERSAPVSLDSELLAWDGAPIFTPDATFAYVASTGALDPRVTGTFRPAWHTHPAS